MPKVSVIIVNFNGQHFLTDCLLSLSAQTMTDFEVIIVDNGSTDTSADWLKATPHSFVKPVFLDRNYGFGVGNNRGFEQASGDIIVLLNNDTILANDFLKHIIASFDENPTTDMVAPLILLRDKPEVIDKAGGHLFYPDGLNRGRFCGDKLSSRHQIAGPCFYPDGCAGAFRRSLIEEAGFFDEDFFLYGEDTDLGLRYTRFGARCRFEPGARVFHVHSATAGKYSPDKAYYVERNRWFVMMKNLPWYWIMVSPLFTLVRYFFQTLALLMGKGSPARFNGSHARFGLLKTLVRANADGLRKAPMFLKKRKSLKTKFKVGGFKFSLLMFRYFLSPVKLAFRD